jgi:hypothetical protein
VPHIAEHPRGARQGHTISLYLTFDPATQKHCFGADRSHDLATLPDSQAAAGYAAFQAPLDDQIALTLDIATNAQTSRQHRWLSGHLTGPCSFGT